MKRCGRFLKKLPFLVFALNVFCLSSCKDAHDGLKNPLSDFENKPFTAEVSTNNQEYVGVKTPIGEAALPNWSFDVEAGCNRDVLSALPGGPFRLVFSFALSGPQGDIVIQNEKTVNDFGSGEYAYDWGAGEADENGYGTPFFKTDQYVSVPTSDFADGGTLSGSLSLSFSDGSIVEGSVASWGMAFASDGACFWYTSVNKLHFA